MNEWLDALGALLVAAAVLLVPGLAAGRLAGLRGPLAWGMAPAFSMTALSVGAVLAPLAAVPWGWGAALGALAIGVLGVAATRLVPTAAPATSEAASEATSEATSGRLGPWPLLGAAAGAAVILSALVRGVGRPGALSQTYDAVFHLNAVRWVLDHQDGSSLHLAAAGRGDGTLGFYPGAWHDLVALVASRPLSGALDLPAAANATAAAAAVFAWPLGCAALAHVTIGSRWRGAAAVAGLLSAGLTASPYLLLSFGVLWPNAMAGCLLPGVAALLVSAVRSGAWRERLLVLACLPGLALVHPNAIFALAVLALPLVGGAVAPVLRSGWARNRLRTAGIAAAVVAGGCAAALLITRTPLAQGVRGSNWPARESVSQAAGEVLLNAQNRGPATWVLSACVVIGAVALWRRSATRWVVVAHVLVGLLYVLAAGSDSALSQSLTGFWYNDSFRLAALIPITGVLLGSAGVLAAADAVRSWRVASPHPALRRPAVALVAVLAAVVAGSGGLSWRDHVDRLRPAYAGSSYLGPQERALMLRLPREVPAGSIVAGNPWNGAALTYALGDRRSLFPHLVSGWDPDRQLVASALDDVADQPGVCAALNRLGVRWAVGGTSTFWTHDRRQALYAGLTDLSGRPGLREVDRGGRLALYEVTACDTGNGRGPRL